MSYQVIARKWRPQNFEQLVGQTHISTTLQNALKNQRLPHAILFTGPRGTGKTSSARILAKALRCPNAKDFIPCGKCTECEEIALSRSPSVLEIDGASNNGVDAIRELRDTVAYAPSSGKYKIYIIDEVHMLSTSAFNALLKTLEEPPAHVVFIMATTEVHKIPQTILSRCQRFDFRRIPTRQITEHLRMICQKDNIQAEDDALWMIARQGDGSMRDSQSLLDQVVSFANGPLTKENVINILGLTDRALIIEVLTALVQRDPAQMLSVIKKIASAACEPHLFVKDILENVRHLLLIKFSNEKTNELVELPDSEIRFLSDLSRNISEEDIHLLFDMTLKGAGEIPRSSEPMIVLEMLLLRMVAAPRVIELQNILQSSAPVKTQGQAQVQPQPVMKKTASVSLSMNPNEKWFELVQDLKTKDSLLAAKVENLLFIGDKNKTIELGVPAKMGFLAEQIKDPALREKLQGSIDQMWGPGYALSIRMAQDTVGANSAKGIEQEKETKRQSDLTQQVAAHPKVKAASAIFKGQIKSIKENT